ncbi:MAG: glycosyltransferase family 4 protein [Vicinamibacterales bacterium]
MSTVLPPVPETLFLTPVVPAPEGNGLAMRAGMLLEGLARDSHVTLVTIPLAGAPPESWSEFVRRRTRARHCIALERATPPQTPAKPLDQTVGRDRQTLRRFLQPSLTRLLTAQVLEDVRRTLDATRFDLVVVFRLYLAPTAECVRLESSRPPRLWLDADDDEASTRREMAEVHTMRGEADAASDLQAEADRYAVLEAQWLPRFDVVTMCSDADRAIVSARSGHPNVRVLPNCAPMVHEPTERAAESRPAAADARTGAEKSPTHPLTLLFVGSLGYFPNADAATVLCRDVVTALRQLTSRAVRVDLVGARPNPEVRALASVDGVRIHENVDALAPFYERADVAVVALRAGGGTRIKILEALLRGCPVVSTAIGARGLDAEHGRHLLIADDPVSMAAACLQVAENPALAATLRENGRALATMQYGLARSIEVIRVLAAAP